MIYMIILGILLGISFIVWLIYKIGYLDGSAYGYKKGRADELVHQLKKESKHLEKKSKELKEDEKGKEGAVDDL